MSCRYADYICLIEKNDRVSLLIHLSIISYKVTFDNFRKWFVFFDAGTKNTEIGFHQSPSSFIPLPL